MTAALLALIPAAIPPALRAQPWVLWRAEPTGAGKPTKVPMQIARPSQRASSTDPATWGTFDDAVEAYTSLVDEPAGRGHVDGIGVVLTADAGLTCIDLDAVITAGGELDGRAAAIVAHCRSWTEISPSGTGLHLFVEGTLPEALVGPQFEAYTTARYIAVTGHRWPGTPDAIAPAQPYLDHLVARARARQAPRAPYSGPQTAPPDDLAGALIAKLHDWRVPVAHVKPWSDGYLAELTHCPWADKHTTGAGGAAVVIHASGALDFTCLHSHCAGRDWRDFRAHMETAR